MQLDYHTGRETVAIFEPDYEQVIVLSGLVALCESLRTKKRQVNRGLIRRRKIANQTQELMRDVRTHVAQAPTSQMHLMGEFELEAVQRGAEELLSDDNNLEYLSRPLIPGGDPLRNQLDSIAKTAKYRMYAETIYVALNYRELPAGWQPVFKESKN